jgi:hypothetical protein
MNHKFQVFEENKISIKQLPIPISPKTSKQFLLVREPKKKTSNFLGDYLMFSKKIETHG